jgi:hypothetical protein
MSYTLERFVIDFLGMIELLLKPFELYRLELINLLKDYVYLILAWAWGTIISLVALLMNNLRRGWKKFQKHN